MADLARRATRWVGTLSDGEGLDYGENMFIFTTNEQCIFRYGQITFLTFRRPTTLTFDLKFWKYLSVTVYPKYVCQVS